MMSTITILRCFVVISMDLVGQVAWNTILPDIKQLPTDSRVALQSAYPQEAFIRLDGTFIMQDVKPGNHILTVKCRNYAFPSLWVQVPSSNDGSEDVLPIIKPHVFGQASSPPPGVGASLPAEPRLQYPIKLVPITKIQYEEVKVGFNPIGMLLGNPLYLLMGGMVLFMMVTPKLLNMIDPEALAEVQANQVNMRKQMAAMQDMDFASGGLSKMLTPPVTNEPSETSKISASPSKPASKSTEASHVKRRK
uniref:Peptidase n=1 Tax=Puccinia cf. psidii AE-2014 TaxID=1505670 RepID=A0A060IMY7_9BASI|nr:peptidase [Puccinia cf. psidii AE-2014]